MDPSFKKKFVKKLRTRTKSAKSISKTKSVMKSTFGKASRFLPIKKDFNSIYLNLPSTLSDRSCSFGVGKRWNPVNSVVKNNPSPGDYDFRSQFANKIKGPSFKHKYIENNTKFVPGPGAYNPYHQLGKNALKFSIRPKTNSIKRSDTPPPNSYNPKFTLVQKQNIRKITFGYGKRSKIYGSDPNLPGPGSYDINSQFDNMSEKATSRSSSPFVRNRSKKEY